MTVPTGIVQEILGINTCTCISKIPATCAQTISIIISSMQNLDPACTAHMADQIHNCKLAWLCDAFHEFQYNAC